MLCCGAVAPVPSLPNQTDAKICRSGESGAVTSWGSASSAAASPGACDEHKRISQSWFIVI